MADARGLTKLDAPSQRISDLRGIKAFTSSDELDLGMNRIRDFAPL